MAAEGPPAAGRSIWVLGPEYGTQALLGCCAEWANWGLLVVGVGGSLAAMMAARLNPAQAVRPHTERGGEQVVRCPVHVTHQHQPGYVTPLKPHSAGIGAEHSGSADRDAGALVHAHPLE